MNNCLSFCLIGSILMFGGSKYTGSTTASVVLAGGIIKTQSLNIEKKYKRKDCPVCKGKGWYISGDGISKVNCGYCEAETEQTTSTIKPNCKDGKCSVPTRK